MKHDSSPSITTANENLEVSVDSLTEKFRSLLDRMSVLLASEGIGTQAYADPKLPWFSRLSPEEMSKIVETVGLFLEIMMEVKEEDSFALHNPKALWRVLSRLNFRHSDDLFVKMTNEDYFEIHDTNYRQIFCSFNWFELSSFTLEDLYTRPWMELYDKEESIIALSFERIAKVLEPEASTNVSLEDVPSHIVLEKKLPVRRRTLTRPKFLSPLKDKSGAPIGFVYAFTVDEAIVETIE